MEKRTIKLTAHTNEKEYEEIKKRAKLLNLSISSYLRSLAMNYPIKSKVDALCYTELSRARADLGRLGGLFKLWLTEKEIKSSEYKSIDELIDVILDAQDKIVEVAQQMVRKL